MDDRDRRPLVVCVAEKPSLAASIASFLSDGKHVTRRGNLDVHEFARRHDGVLCDFRVTAVTGHVLSIDFPARFQSWDVDPAALFDAPVVKKEASRGSRVVEHLEREARGAAQLILWLDCDREGENICFEVMDACVPVMRPRSALRPPVRRAKFSAVTKPSVEAAMRNLGLPDVNQARAVDARQELDLKIGVAFTRFQTNHFRDKFSGLDSSVVSYGPCQTPTLSFVAARRKQIAAHDPEPFWRVVLTCPDLFATENSLSTTARRASRASPLDDDERERPRRVREEKKADANAREDSVTNAPNAPNAPNSVVWRRGRVFDKSVGEAYARLVSESARDDASYARVSMSTETETSKPPPCGLNTVDLLKSCSAGMGMGAHRVMQIAERLYIDGRISYPRTESSAFPKGFDFRETLRACVCHPDLGDGMVAEMLDSSSADSSSAEANALTKDTKDSVARRETRNTEQPAFRAPRGGVDAGDHPPITPAGISASSPADVGGVDAWRVYDFIVRRFVAACARDCVCVTRAIALEVGGELFDARASETKQPGWTLAMPWRAPRETRFARAFVTGDATPVANVELAADVTSPPNAMTESELISLMEQHGIGTDASIPTHINNVEKRKYVSIDQKTRRVDVTDLGFVLVAGYDAVDPELASPFTRKAVENQLDLIATGKADHAAVVAHALEQFSAKYAHFVKNVDTVDSLFELKFDPSARASLAEAPPFSKCGRCLRFLRLSQTRARKVLHCVTENETYALPHGAEVAPWDGRSCPLCDFELLLCSFGSNDKARFPLCVRCFKTKPVPVCGGVDKKPSRGPFACPHPSAHPIIEERLVCPCPTCDDALMVEPRRNVSRKKTSRSRVALCCASCETTLRLPPSVASASPTRHLCGGCGARCVEVRFDEEKMPLAEGKTTLVACVACEDVLRRDAVLLQKLSGSGADDGSRGGRGGGRGGGGRRL